MGSWKGLVGSVLVEAHPRDWPEGCIFIVPARSYIAALAPALSWDASEEKVVLHALSLGLLRVDPASCEQGLVSLLSGVELCCPPAPPFASTLENKHYYWH